MNDAYIDFYQIAFNMNLEGKADMNKTLCFDGPSVQRVARSTSLIYLHSISDLQIAKNCDYF